MAIDPKINAKHAFGLKGGEAPPRAAESPARTKQDAPKPELRPGGSWRAQANAVDQAVRERSDAAKARTAERENQPRRKRRGMGMGFRRSAKGDDPA